MEDLNGLISSKSLVMRDGAKKEIESTDLVSGDLVLLNAGDIIPADGIFLETKNMSVNESSLTGESFPVDKNTGVLSPDTPLSKRTNSGFMGTNMVSGNGLLLITDIGKDTYFGQVSKDMSKSEPVTEFRKGLNKFGRLLMAISGIMIVLIFLLNLIMKKPIYDSFMFAISLAVGITPQLLPAISSVNLSIGANRMAEKNVIIRQLEVIDNIGGMDVLCSDKTGTITQGSVKVDAAYSLDGEKSDLLLSLASQNAFYSTSNNNNIDTALMKDMKEEDKSEKLVDEKAYNFTDKVSSVAIEYKAEKLLGSKKLIIMKGAIKNVLSFCDRALLADQSLLPIDQQIDKINAMAEDLSEKGYRCLGLAIKDFEDEPHFNDKMIFVGFITLFDPLKEDSLEVIHELEDLNVDFKIITGDSLLVAKYLAQELGIDSKEVIAASDLKNYSDQEQREKVESSKIFAEVEPEE